MVAPSSSTSSSLDSGSIANAAEEERRISIIRIAPTSADVVEEENDDGDHDWWITQVLELQRQNHKHHLSDEESNENGFVTVFHRPTDLLEMIKYCPQYLAVVDVDPAINNKTQPAVVVGYTLTADHKAISSSPSLSKLYKVFFDMVDDDTTTTATTTTTTIPSPSNDDWVFGAQVCVSSQYRRRGILKQLYDYQCKDLGTKVITAVDHSNRPSLQAHLKANFTVLKKYDKGGKDDTGWSLLIRHD
jgi:ribosomal protein S18 acetylase RimI-like enzyme